MTCRLCELAVQYTLNWINLLDHAGSTLLLGDANKTMRTRTARARAAGSRAAAIFCALLTWGQRVVTFGQVTRDHCQYALDQSVLPNGRELWDWNTGQLRRDPRTIVDDVELRNRRQTP